MSIFECAIAGTATIRRVGESLEWLGADPEIHVAADLLDDASAVEWISGRYSIDEPCPHAQRVHHARLHKETL